MKINTGLTGIQILLIILALFVFSFIGLSIPRILVFLASPKEQQTQREVAKHIEEQIEEKKDEKPCFGTDDYWFWSAGDKKGKAQISFSPDKKGAVGSLLDEAAKRTVYSFQIGPTDSKMSLAIYGQEPKAYGTGAVSCNIITLNIEKACGTACVTDDPNDYGKKKVDPSSVGFPNEISIVQ